MSEKRPLDLVAAVAIIVASPSVSAERGDRPKVADEGSVMVLEYAFEDPSVARKGEFHTFQIEGCKRFSRAGAPAIAVKPVRILVPHGKRIATVASYAMGVYELAGTFSIDHGKRPRFKQPYGADEIRPAPATTPDPEIYAMTAFWPEVQHRLVTVQSDRGYNVAHIVLFPLQYSPATGKVRMAAKMRLHVQLQPLDALRVARPTSALRRKMARLIDNPDIIKTYDRRPTQRQRGQPKDSKSSPPLEPGGALLASPDNPHHGASYKYVVITSEYLADEANIPDATYSFQALCASRTARGIPAGVITTEWIYANYAGPRPAGGDDNQTRIRNFLVDAYQTWGTEYALLGGNKNIIPVRHYIDTDYSPNDEEYEVPTDLYYGCVDPYSSDDPAHALDGDADGKYGEFDDGLSGGEIDLTAEVFTGRAAVETPQEVVNFVRKTLVYETIDDPYLNEAGTMGSHLGFGGVQEFTKPFAELIRLGSNEYTGHFTCGLESPTIPNARAFNVTTLYDEDWYIDNVDGSYDSSTARANETVNWRWSTMGWDAATDLVPYLNGENGHTTPHVLYISDHGSWDWGMVKLSTEQTSDAKCDHLGNVKNTRPFFFYDDSCNVGEFDRADSFGEVITTMEHGAFACILNAREGLGGEGNSLDSPSTLMTREFFHSVLGDGILELGRAHQEAKESSVWRLGDLAWSRYVYLELALFGDPAVRLRVTTIEDNCPNDPDKTEPGACGCGVADEDSDGDGTANCEDDCPDNPQRSVAGPGGCDDDDGEAGAGPGTGGTATAATVPGGMEATAHEGGEPEAISQQMIAGQPGGCTAMPQRSFLLSFLLLLSWSIRRRSRSKTGVL